MSAKPVNHRARWTDDQLAKLGAAIEAEMARGSSMNKACKKLRPVMHRTYSSIISAYRRTFGDMKTPRPAHGRTAHKPGYFAVVGEFKLIPSDSPQALAQELSEAGEGQDLSQVTVIRGNRVKLMVKREYVATEAD